MDNLHPRREPSAGTMNLTTSTVIFAVVCGFLAILIYVVLF